MAEDNKKYEPHSFKSFLEKYYVTIPMVQRDYAQGRTSTEVNRIRNRFLDAIHACLKEAGLMKMDFVYGEKENVYSKTEVKLERIIVTPLDGQQRLTTLFLLHWYAAKRMGIPSDDKCFAFMKHFTYDIRPSSRDFCAHLLEFSPSFNSSIEKQLVDEYWFMGEWNNDPTIRSMLVMLDAIKEKFSDISDLWTLLTGEKKHIIFYFLPLEENGLSDELYIKMNSRGKKLTAFEHFKAEFEDLYERDSKEQISICHKFDVEWMDVLFPYRNKEDLVDTEFMRYFFYISHILCYQQNVKKSNDEFELINILYKDSPENRSYFEDAMDCWYDVIGDFKSIDEFFTYFLTQSEYQEGKVATYKTIDEYRNTQNFFNACIKLYQVNNNFSNGDFLFLFGILTYLMNKKKEGITEYLFKERLRILRNLIWNSSSGEIRGDAEYMQDLLSEVQELIIHGRINKKLKHGFNGIQEDEEIDKQIKKTVLKPKKLERLQRFEDHPLIYGYALGMGYEDLDLTDIFYTVFKMADIDFSKIHRAMISIGDYRQKSGNRYYMGNQNRSTWSLLLHKSRNREGFEDNTMAVLKELLNKVRDGKTLEDIISDYVEDQEKQKKYPWRYYFAKYPDMMRGSEGELKWENNDYVCTSLNKHQFNGQHWYPFLNVLYKMLAEEFELKYGKKILTLDNYGNDLVMMSPSASIRASESGFRFFSQNNEEKWNVHQDNDGIDEEDRILLAADKIRTIVEQCFISENQI
jgi:hypothetical protein